MESAKNQLPESIEHREGMNRNPSVSTRAIHTGHEALDHPGLGAPVIPPITLSTTYQQKTPGVYKYDYSRGNNYSREILEKTIAALEHGERCSTFASGLAATNAVIQLLSSGDHIVAFDDLYGGTNRLMRQIVARSGITTEFIDLTNVDLLKPALKSNTKLLWLESPSNPTLKMVDIKRLSEIAHEHDPNIIVVVDNTFMTSCFQNPLTLGADIVLHSVTKYMNGHTDVVMGALIMKDEKLADRLAFIQFAAGAVPAPFDCYQTLRGLRTLGVRMREHMKNGLAVARYLEAHDKVDKVLHPGLKSHPQYELGRRQMSGYSGMVSIYLKANKEQTFKFVASLKLFSLAESLGGFESLIEVPSVMTHASVPEWQRKELGITDGLIRLSVGIEDVEDLLDDLKQALDNM